MNKFYDLVVVGGGIVGAATARSLKMRFPKCSIAVLEKENDYSYHQTGHNSGVIHAGIYYKPGTLTAQLCVKGSAMVYKYCDENKVPYKKPGKLVVATRPMEVPRLENLFERATKNGCREISMISSEEISKLEPNVRGLKGLLSPHTGIIDFAVMTRSLIKDFQKRGGESFKNFEVENFVDTHTVTGDDKAADYPVTIIGKGSNQMVHGRYAVTCAGLQSDRVAVMTGCSPSPKIVPFRGEYLILKPERSNLVKMNIYPVPDPNLPFLGVHYTPRMDGSIWLGPNAVLALSREKYARWPADLLVKDVMDYAFFPGLMKLGAKNFSYGFRETLRSLSIRAQVKELQRFVPQLKVSDVERGNVGIRAQAVGADGSMVNEFSFDKATDTNLGSRVIHVRNAPSPAATSSLAIAEMITDRMSNEFSLDKIATD